MPGNALHRITVHRQSGVTESWCSIKISLQLTWFTEIEPLPNPTECRKKKGLLCSCKWERLSLCAINHRQQYQHEHQVDYFLFGSVPIGNVLYIVHIYSRSYRHQSKWVLSSASTWCTAFIYSQWIAKNIQYQYHQMEGEQYSNNIDKRE